MTKKADVNSHGDGDEEEDGNSHGDGERRREQRWGIVTKNGKDL